MPGFSNTHTNLRGSGFMKNTIAGLAMATMVSGVVSIPTMAWAGNDNPLCKVILAGPPLPTTPPPQATGGQRCDP